MHKREKGGLEQDEWGNGSEEDGKKKLKDKKVENDGKKLVRCVKDKR